MQVYFTTSELSIKMCHSIHRGIVACFFTKEYRRRIKTEEKAKVVAFVLGEEFIKFLAALAVLHWRI